MGKPGIRFAIYPPAGGHQVFRIIKMDKATMKSETVRLPEIDKLNADFLAEKISETKIREALNKLRADLNAKNGIVAPESDASAANLKVLESYWASEYEYRETRLVDKRTPKYDLLRAIKVIGKLNLRTATRTELQKAVDKKLSGNKQRRVVSKLNQLLKYLKRDFELLQAKKERRPIKFLTSNDIAIMLMKIPEPKLRTFTEVLFRTGCRVGEAFAFEPSKYNSTRNTLRIEKQKDAEGKVRGTKNAKERTAIVLPDSADLLAEWFKVRRQISRTDRAQIARTITRACTKAFPTDKSKWITAHDLRHSYVIHLLSMGVPLSAIALSIGDSIRVAEEYYAGYDLSPSSVDLINQILKQGKVS